MKQSITYLLVATIVPAATVVGDLILEIYDASDVLVTSQTVSDADTSVDVDIAVAGTYTAHLKRVDADGALLGAVAISDPKTITVAPASIIVQTAGTVSFAA